MYTSWVNAKILNRSLAGGSGQLTGDVIVQVIHEKRLLLDIGELVQLAVVTFRHM